VELDGNEWGGSEGTEGSFIRRLGEIKVGDSLRILNLLLEERREDPPD